MKPLYRGLIIAVVQCGLVLSLAGKYQLDRERLPRVWVKTAPFDPNMPIRGRYVRLSLQVDGTPRQANSSWMCAELKAAGERLTAAETSTEPCERVWRGPDGAWTLSEPVAFFIPEHVPDPSLRPPGEELWVEVSVPRHGPPRPVRLAVQKDGVRKILPLQ